MVLPFVYTQQDFITDVCRSGDKLATPLTAFDSAMRAGWTDRMEKGLFRYHLRGLETRILPGQHGFVAQLNVKRGTERRKPQEILSIKQEFNGKQFNFNKINPDEVLFEMVKGRDGGTASPPPSKMVVLVNVSPLEFGHCLFVLDPLRCFPQILIKSAIQISIESVLLSSDPGFRVGFNSLGAFASVNHLHLHGYYLDHELKIESIPVEPLVPEKGLYLSREFPGGFVFYAEADTVETVAEVVCQVTDFLVDDNIAHNLFLTRGCPPYGCAQSNEDRRLRSGVRIVVWPRVACFGAKEESAFNVALCELAGHLPFKNKDDFERSTEKDVVEIIQRYLLPQSTLRKLEQQLINHLRH
ncbi:GDP-D-glucose phosphorylase 1 [Oryzias melastigma]|uniref:GDP-D-glucose phosphorylase 1 n=1 Tax=Oryzias melastigma TaxID=30732 RepID=A0A834FK33_ORYME|nr:GDP-D-glucose phosphorylase 1 [Oryzias melastigma]KAF6735633.1 GDP-D-glucose phosphorylase 1 [Oryzias melastigma]